jgi:adenylosuccinate lyase
MPLPKRYAGQVPEIVRIWEAEGNFESRIGIWLAQSRARNKLYGKPNKKQLKEIEKGLKLSARDIEELNVAKGHETNKLLRKVQSKISPEAGNFIHLGNTSYDVVDTGLSLQIIESLEILKKDFIGLSESLKKLALKHKNTIQIGRTHGQHAIPQTFGRQVVGWYAEVKRGIERIDLAKQVISVGRISGEVGTHVFIEPELEEETLSQLGLKPDEASTQIISRDRHTEVVALMGINSSTLARIAENIRSLTLTEIGEVREPFESDQQQGSSAMPHKRNPELCERIIGLDREVRGAVTMEFGATKVLFERDMSHSSTERYVFPDVFGNLDYMARLAKRIVDGLEVFPEKMKRNLELTHGAIYSSNLLNALIATGKFTRTQAYDLVKRLAQQAIDKEINLRVLAGKEPQIAKLLKPKQLDELFDLKFYLRNIGVAFKRTRIGR